MKSAKSKRQFTLLTLVVALGVAVYLNWEYAKTDAPFALQDPGAVSANAAVETVTDGTTSGVLAALPVQEALVLIAISVLLTVVAGLLPARSASKKDPVEALRSE